MKQTVAYVTETYLAQFRINDLPLLWQSPDHRARILQTARRTLYVYQTWDKYGRTVYEIDFVERGRGHCDLCGVCIGGKDGEAESKIRGWCAGCYERFIVGNGGFTIDVEQLTPLPNLSAWYR